MYHIFRTINHSFFLATAAGRLIFQCDLYANKFISMFLNRLTLETIGLLTDSCIPVGCIGHACVLQAADQVTVGG